MDALQGTTLGVAVLGAVLGVLNTWRMFRQDRVRLRVEPQIAAIRNRSLRLCVEVTNLSNFEVTIAQVAFLLHGRKVRVAVGCEALGVSHGGQEARLSPRASHTFFVPASAAEDDDLASLSAVQVRTACGHFAKASNGALRWYVANRPAATFPFDVTMYDARRDGLVVSSIHGPPVEYSGPGAKK